MVKVRFTKLLSTPKFDTGTVKTNFKYYFNNLQVQTNTITPIYQMN